MAGDLLSCLLAHLGKDNTLILSGGVGAGKTHTAEGLAVALKERGVAVGGILSPRIVRNKETAGYTVRDLQSGEERPFAGLVPPGIAVGRFFISEDGLAFASDAIERAVKIAQVVFVDEVGRLELAGEGLAAAVRTLLHSQALPVLLVRSSFVDAVVRTFVITRFLELAVGPGHRETNGVKS